VILYSPLILANLELSRSFLASILSSFLQLEKSLNISASVTNN
jgi:hypothetical protein